GVGDNFLSGFRESLSGGGKNGIDVNGILGTVFEGAKGTAHAGGGQISTSTSNGILGAIGTVISAGTTIGTSALTSVGNLIPGFNLKGQQGGGGLATGLGGASGIVGMAANALGLGALTSVGTLVPGFNVKGSDGGGGLASGLRSALGIVGLASGSLVGTADE